MAHRWRPIQYLSLTQYDKCRVNQFMYEYMYLIGHFNQGKIQKNAFTDIWWFICGTIEYEYDFQI